MEADPAADAAPRVGLAAGRGVWVVLPTYNERENIEPISGAILAALPMARLLVVDDASPDGTGEIADRLATGNERAAASSHRSAKQGLGRRYRDGFRWVLERPDTEAVVQMDADFSHDPRDLPRLLAPLMRDAQPEPRDALHPWGRHRRLAAGTAGSSAAAGRPFARTVLLLPYRDLTGGFKAWRRELLEGIRLRDAHASGYGFQVETTWWAHRRGSRIVQVPIVFRERIAGKSKMHGGIVREAMLMVVRLRWEAIREALRGRR